ncbi:MAG: hypothetical protein QW035_01750 [Candidatus Anstonellales archaeon]
MPEAEGFPKPKAVPEKVVQEATTFVEYYIKELLAQLGKAYKKGAWDCVTVPMNAIRKLYLKITGEKPKNLDLNYFRNGGLLLQRYKEAGGSLSIISPDELKEGKGISTGNLVMRLIEVKKGDEKAISAMKAALNAGDLAVYQDWHGDCHLLKKKEALGKINELKDGEHLYIVRHYLTADTREGELKLIHASSAKGKVVKEPVEDYLKDKVNQKSFYIVIDLEKALGVENWLRGKKQEKQKA